ncbi:MAG: sulfur carrier protein ThiS [Chitinivibrionales bacterium]|nr:sulfur carrier protein ThiS [Chitinivibrionales bacterium]MBD3396929.1 sulfur carrier protein ThiS [Chitinivibrionales bacterium]
MTITLNGKKGHVAANTSILSLLEKRDIRPGSVVVEVNLNIIPRDAYGLRMVAEGDTVEILRFVGGG